MPARTLVRRTLVAASLLAAAWPSTASADRVHGTRSEQLVERSHRIRLTLDHGVATMRVRRTVHNGGERHDQAMFWLDLPTGAVATGLRTKGTLRGKPRWFPGELLEAELAAARYRELTGIGGYSPKDPALLSWRSMEELALQVFPVAPGSDKTVEYTLSLPTVYEEGRDHLELPVMGTDDHPAEVVLHTSSRRDQLFVDGSPVAHGFPITLDDTHTVSLARRDAPTLEAHLASIPIDDDLALMQFEIAMASKISTIPRDARVVVVLDGSRSMGDDQRGAQLQAARAYLGHFAEPRLNARAEVLVFDRTVEGRNGGLVSARKALADLQHLDLTGRNGSHVDDALERAGDLLVARGKGPRRIVLFTDARTRAGLEPARLRALAERSKAIVHVAVVAGHSDGLDRDDDHPWSEVARATGGLVWTAGTLVSDDDAPAVYEELARPLRLDRLQVHVPPLDDDDIMAPERLPEGEGFALLELASSSVDHLRVEGELWSQPVRETLFPEKAHGRRWAALIFGQSLHEQLDDAQMMPLAMLGGAVSPVTSYLAIEPGVRPSTEGLDWGTIGSGFGAGFGSGSGHGRGVRVGSRRKDLRQDFLDQAVRDALDACGGPGLAVRVTLESTLEEIVQVASIHLPNADDPILTTCLEDGIWDVPLGSDFVDLWREWTVDLPSA